MHRVATVTALSAVSDMIDSNFIIFLWPPAQGWGFVNIETTSAQTKKQYCFGCFLSFDRSSRRAGLGGHNGGAARSLSELPGENPAIHT